MRLLTRHEQSHSAETPASQPLFEGTYIIATAVNGYAEVSLATVKLTGPIFTQRTSEALRYFKKAMIKAGADETASSAPTVRVPLQGLPWRRCRNIDDRLTEIVEAPVPPRIVEKCLGITGRERNRWMKDGRLPSCARRRSNRTETSFSIPYFPAGLVNDLCLRPEVIGAWREMDRQLSANS